MVVVVVVDKMVGLPSRLDGSGVSCKLHASHVKILSQHEQPPHCHLSRIVFVKNGVRAMKNMKDGNIDGG